MRLVIIGNGMAATRLIAALTGRAAGRFAITVIGDEPEHAYNRIQLSPVLGGEKQAADICLQDDDWYQSRGVTVMFGDWGGSLMDARTGTVNRTLLDHAAAYVAWLVGEKGYDCIRYYNLVNEPLCGVAQAMMPRPTQAPRPTTITRVMSSTCF